MDWSRVLGFATDAGGRTHHTAILARSLKVPAVVGLRDLSRRVRPGHAGDHRRRRRVRSQSTRRPARSIEAQRRAPARRRAAAGVGASARAGGDAPTASPSGSTPTSSASKTCPRFSKRAPKASGLFRSEFLLAGRAADQLSEDQQVEIYRGAARRAGAAPGHHPHVRSRRAAVRAVELARSARRASGAARRASRPGAPRRCSGRSCARCCARRRPGACA